MDYVPIPPSITDLERQRLESTIDQDLGSLSLASLITTTASELSDPASSMTSIPSIEFPRGFGEGETGRPDPLVHPSQYRRPSDNSRLGPHGTPRAMRKISGLSGRSVDVDGSPVSTDGHHVSAVTLGAGVYRTKGFDDWESGDEFDPERSLGRLVGELGKAMGGRISPRPTSPFTAMSPPRSPRSPSPFSSMQHQQHNLSLTLNRNDPLPSPPISRSGSRSSDENNKYAQPSRFSSIARELGADIKSRKVLGEATSHNVPEYGNAALEKERRSKQLQGDRRTASAPARASRGDITGMTGLMETPAKGLQHGTLGKNGDVGADSGANVAHSLSLLQARLRALETENSVSRRRVRELEDELDRAIGEVDEARKNRDVRLRDVIGEKSALEDLIKSLRNHLARVTVELEQNKALVSELRHASRTPPPPHSPPRYDQSVDDELAALRREIERLSREIQRLSGIVEAGLETRRKARSDRTIRMEAEEARRLQSDFDDDVQRIKRDIERRTRSQGVPPTPGPSKLRQGLHAAAVDPATLMPPTVEPPTRVRARHNPTPPSSDIERSPTSTAEGSGRTKSKTTRTRTRPTTRVEGPSSPFPSIRAEDEEEFFSILEDHEIPMSPLAKNARTIPKQPRSASLGINGDRGDLPPQTVLARVLRELEDDFTHYKAIYSELADQYKVLDAASAVAKRHVLAEHLKEVIDTLEQKADQIAALYDLLKVQDRPVRSDEMKDWGGVKRSVPDILRMVRDTIGEEGTARLRAEGVGEHRRNSPL